MVGIVALVGCSSSLVPASGLGGSGGTASTGGVAGTAGAPSTGGRGGAPVDGGAGPKSCGNTVCTSTEFCCDSLCSKCAPMGALCTLGCDVADAGFGAGACASLEQQYLDAIRAAQACTTGPSAQCGAMAHSWLPGDPCGCDMIFVNDATKPDAIYQMWLSAGCQAPSTCTATCALPSRSGVCIATDGGVTGLCQFAAPHTL